MGGGVGAHDIARRHIVEWAFARKMRGKSRLASRPAELIIYRSVRKRAKRIQYMGWMVGVGRIEATELPPNGAIVGQVIGPSDHTFRKPSILQCLDAVTTPGGNSRYTFGSERAPDASSGMTASFTPVLPSEKPQSVRWGERGGSAHSCDPGSQFDRFGRSGRRFSGRASDSKTRCG